MNPLHRIRAFTESILPKVKKEPANSKSSEVARRSLGEGKAIASPLEKATLANNQVKFLRESMEKAPEEGKSLVRLNLSVAEMQLKEASDKIKRLSQETLPKSARKEVEKTQSKLAETIAKPLHELNKALSKLGSKAKVTEEKRNSLNKLLEKYEIFAKSSLNDKTDPALQKELLKTRDALGKAALHLVIPEEFNNTKQYLGHLRFHHSDPGFDKRQARFILDYLIRNPPSHEVMGEASDLWERLR